MDDKRPVLVDSPSENRDPVAKEPDSQPVGTAMGSAGKVATGAAVNPTIESEYWNKTFKDRPYYKPGKQYSDYEAAYRLGWESANRQEYEGREFDDVEPELHRSWKGDQGAGDPWTDARDATRDAWLRVRTP